MNHVDRFSLEIILKNNVHLKMSKIPEDQLAALKASFEELDKDKSGTLEADEVVTFLTGNGYPAGFGQIVFKAYDTNKDGKVQFDLS
jgi:Ca2+-binding EF-hand superfamily protein